MIAVDTAGRARSRAVSIAALRQRIASLGGLPGQELPLAGAVRPSAAVPAAGRRPPAGFVSRSSGAGDLLVRQVVVDLGSLLDRSGAAGPPTWAQLLRLAHGRHGADEGAAAAGASPGVVGVLDIESLGLRGSGVVGFMVGIGILDGRELRVEQLLLSDPGAERALLTAALSRLAGIGLLLTYNGRSFDLPVLQARCIVSRLDTQDLLSRFHCDLLGPVRRLFRDRLDNVCTLRQAESGLLGLDRVDDVGGAEAPWRYRAWLRGSPDEPLAGVVRHNQLDLCATVVLAARLASHVDGHLVEPRHPADRYRLAVHLERSGVAAGSLDHYRAAFGAGQSQWSRSAGHRLAQRLRRAGAPGLEEAERILRELLRQDQFDLRAARSLAIMLERQRRHPEALATAEHAWRLCDRLPPWRDRAGAPSAEGWREDWGRRVRRLRTRCARVAA